ncbi:MAG: long-chain-fatty-acid--CoA ligase [Gammaproteobacteria bacterium]|nr:long-chain-fatty-acid--CoA ligase [Gammaproteobacteria bacterium]MBU1644734.1 long-chain-fatty-acid--CoA ligase [Gammaproteobacteria bacterium]MBU1973468.1 long-chain-fatty-acid--CoA ligase [Gammaproteobacteria bacterium]
MEKNWLPSYPEGVPAEIGLLEDASLAELMEKACRRYADKTAFISMGRTLSYGELDRKAAEFAGWLQSVGLGKGKRVALMMPNLLQYPICLFGALRAGCTVVSCNPLYTPRELEHQLKDSGAEVMVVVENFAHTVEQVLPHTAVRHVIVTPMGEMLGTLKGTLVNLVVRHVKKLVPAWRIPGAINFSTALAAGRRHGFQPVEISLDDLAFLQYTGGTTGVAKGAMLSHRNIVSNVTQAHAWIRGTVHEGEELIVTALPLYHIFALTANCLTFLSFGASNLLIANPRDIPGFIKELKHHPFTAITGVNTLFNALLNHPDFAAVDFSRLHVTLGGGMAVQQAVAERWQQVTGCALAQAYGLTETSPAATINPLDLPAFNGAIGLPISSTEVSIRNDAGVELPRGDVGEICIRGPQVTTGYWGRPDETAKAFTSDGFLLTGDMGYVNEKGFVYLVDRKKDIILVSGFNVYPNEVEDVVISHQGVREVAAIGVPHEHSGETVKIFVVRKDPDLTREDLIAHCRTQLTSYKVPHHVEFRDDLPKTNVGKVLRRALKEEGK